MILTVTAHTALDKVLFIDEWVTGSPMRTTKFVTSVGGKGLDSSVVLRHLGVETVGLCFIAGKTGQELFLLLEEYGIKTEPVWVGGETRTAYVIVETQHNRHSHIIVGNLYIEEEHWQNLLEKFSFLVTQADWVICAGSIPPNAPPNLYRRLIDIAHHAGVSILIDSAGICVLECLPSHPDILKMNWDEFEHTFQKKAETLGVLQEQAYHIYQTNMAGALVITCGEKGLLAYSPEGYFHAIAPKQKAINAAGAGDAVSSALVWRFSLGDGWPDALKWAAAVSAATVLTEGTADFHFQDAIEIFHEVEVQQLDLGIRYTSI